MHLYRSIRVLCPVLRLLCVPHISVRQMLHDPQLRHLRKHYSKLGLHSASFGLDHSSWHVFGETGNYILFGSKKVKAVHDEEKALGSIPHGYNKMKCWLEVLSTPTADTPGTTLLLHFDNKRYLIGNIAEGTQRAAIQRKLGLLKVRDIFLTGVVGWSTAGGLLGMILTLADGLATSWEEKRKVDSTRRKTSSDNGEPKKQNLGIHGGKNLTYLLATARRFIFRHGMPLKVDEFKCSASRRSDFVPTWEDDNIKVWTMIITPEEHTVNVRKRSHDEFTDVTSAGGATGIAKCTEEKHDEILSSVVSAMFDSNWRLDTLIKKKLSEVQLPATLFVRDSKGKIQKYDGTTNTSDPSFSDIDVLVRNPWPGALVETLPRTIPSSSSTCYIVRNHPQRGKFDPQKAVALGVPKGKDFARLTKGESITVPSGHVVTPDMVLGKRKEGGGFAVVELPSLDYVLPLISREEWSIEDIMVGVEAVIWILGPGVLHDERLQNFMHEHNHLKHIISSCDCCPNYLAMESVASAALRLNRVDPNSYPIPSFSNESLSDVDSRSDKYERARVGQKLLLEPRVEMQPTDIVPYLDTLRVVKDIPPEVCELARAARAQVLDTEFQAQLESYQLDIPCKDTEITTLGTGSALPSKYRNVSATLVRVPEYGNFLLDCGENTLGQLQRVFGAELPAVLSNLKVIWISHLHADHHLGIASVIKAWSQQIKLLDATENNKLVVASDDGMINWLGEYANVEDFGFERVSAVKLNRETHYQYQPSSGEAELLGFASIKACPVHHCHGAMAVVFNFANGFKLAYSGDCRPSDRFVELGQGATLLIHEATFDDELQGDAIAKKHSTTAEALHIGKRMNARRIVLTHFSQRYQKIPVMDSRGGQGQVAIVAFDYMKVKLKDIAKMEFYRPALMKLYEEKEDE